MPVKPFDLYISYNQAQRVQVEHICQQFKFFNLRIWYDQDNLSDDQANEFDENIQALQSSLIFVCFPSEEYKKNVKNRTELSIAIEQEMRIVCFNLEDYTIPDKNRRKYNITQIKLTDQMINGSNLNEMSLLARALKDEVSKIAQTFRRSYHKTISAWYESIGINLKDNE